jgi:ribonuclease E
MRDIGGLVVVDFIDMRSVKNRRDVEKTIRDAMKDDKARTTASRLSENGLLEINRQRLKKALQLRTHRPCPTCIGTGTIASPELVGLNILRRIETRAVTGRLGGVRVELHPELADALQNERRQELAALEREFDIQIEIVAAGGLHRAEELIDWRQRPKGEERTSSPAVSAADLGQDLGPSTERRAETRATEAEEADVSTETTDQTSAVGDDDAVVEKAKPRRRRRGGRRRKKTGAAQTAAPESQPEETVTTPEEVNPADGESAEAQPAPSDDKTKAAPKKRRRRPRRSRKKAAPTEAKPEEPVAETAQAPDPFSY